MVGENNTVHDLPNLFQVSCGSPNYGLIFVDSLEPAMGIVWIFFGSHQQHHDADYPTTTGPTLCIRCLRIGVVWGLSTFGPTRSLAAIGWGLLQSLCPRDLEVSMWSQVAVN